MNLTDHLNELLRQLVSIHEAKGRAEFYLTRSSDGWYVTYSGVPSFALSEMDFDELRRENLIRLVPTSNGYRGWPTQAGIAMARRGLKVSQDEPVANPSIRLQEAKRTTNLNPAANVIPANEKGETQAIDKSATQLPTLPEAYIARAKAEAVEGVQRARSQLGFMDKAILKLQGCALTEKPGLETERDWRSKNSEKHVRIATRDLFNAFAEQCWSAVRPDAELFSTLLPIVSSEISKTILCPELDYIIHETVVERSVEWAERAGREGAINNSALWSEFRATFVAFMQEESAIFPNAHDTDLLLADGDYEIGLGEYGRWTVAGSAEKLRVEFELQATNAGIALGAPGATEPQTFWLHRLFIDLLEIRSKHLFCARKGKGGMIRRLLGASAIFCARLQRVARENEHRRKTAPAAFRLEANELPVSNSNVDTRVSDRETVTEPVFPQITGTAAEDEGATKGSNPFRPRNWGEVEIRFLSDQRVQIKAGEHTETRNYAEFGFEDGRSKGPNLAWVALRSLAEARGTIRRPAAGQDWPSVEKRMQEIRRVFRTVFNLSEDDPLPYIEGAGYRARFKITCAPSFNT